MDAELWLATFASGRLRHLLKIDLPFTKDLVWVKVSNRS